MRSATHCSRCSPRPAPTAASAPPSTHPGYEASREHQCDGLSTHRGGKGSAGRVVNLSPMATHEIRVFGDPVLKRPAAPVIDVDGALAKLVDAMYETMYDAPGVGLAAPQVGVQRRFFVYDIGDGDGPHVLLNPEIVEASGEWAYEEGCLSLPGLAFE